MAAAPLNWLLKIGGETLKTTAKTLSEAINNLHDSVTSLSTTKADADTTTEALDSLETNKLNISDLLSLEEIEASTSLTGKGATAESVKQINDSLGGIKFGITADGEYGYHKEVEGADTVIPFSSGDSKVYFLGKGNTFDIKALFPKIYQQLTIANFICQLVDSYDNHSIYHTPDSNYWWGKKIAPSWSYDATTGILNCSYYTGVYKDQSLIYETIHSLNVYLVVGKINNL